ncbi:myosin-4-like [Periplaneta americana]|uniref:myosin-4-like n=1 Tax=Periplaneta americana TaxID=6978 RepID=UPI0037E7CF85
MLRLWVLAALLSLAAAPSMFEISTDVRKTEVATREVGETAVKRVEVCTAERSAVALNLQAEKKDGHKIKKMRTVKKRKIQTEMMDERQGDKGKKKSQGKKKAASKKVVYLVKKKLRRARTKGKSKKKTENECTGLIVKQEDSRRCQKTVSKRYDKADLVDGRKLQKEDKVKGRCSVENGNIESTEQERPLKVEETVEGARSVLDEKTIIPEESSSIETEEGRSQEDQKKYDGLQEGVRNANGDISDERASEDIRGYTAIKNKQTNVEEEKDEVLETGTVDQHKGKQLKKPFEKQREGSGHLKGENVFQRYFGDVKIDVLQLGASGIEEESDEIIESNLIERDKMGGTVENNLTHGGASAIAEETGDIVETDLIHRGALSIDEETGENVDVTHRGASSIEEETGEIDSDVTHRGASSIEEETGEIVDVTHRGASSIEEETGEIDSDVTHRGASSIEEETGEIVDVIHRGASSIGEETGEIVDVIHRGAWSIEEETGEIVDVIHRGAWSIEEETGEIVDVIHRGARSIEEETGEIIDSDVTHRGASSIKEETGEIVDVIHRGARSIEEETGEIIDSDVTHRGASSIGEETGEIVDVIHRGAWSIEEETGEIVDVTYRGASSIEEETGEIVDVLHRGASSIEEETGEIDSDVTHRSASSIEEETGEIVDVIHRGASSIGEETGEIVDVIHRGARSIEEETEEIIDSDVIHRGASSIGEEKGEIVDVIHRGARSIEEETGEIIDSDVTHRGTSAVEEEMGKMIKITENQEEAQTDQYIAQIENRTNEKAQRVEDYYQKKVREETTDIELGQENTEIQCSSRKSGQQAVNVERSEGHRGTRNTAENVDEGKTESVEKKYDMNEAVQEAKRLYGEQKLLVEIYTQTEKEVDALPDSEEPGKCAMDTDYEKCREQVRQTLRNSEGRKDVEEEISKISADVLETVIIPEKDYKMDVESGGEEVEVQGKPREDEGDEPHSGSEVSELLDHFRKPCAYAPPHNAVPDTCPLMVCV